MQLYICTKYMSLYNDAGAIASYVIHLVDCSCMDYAKCLVRTSSIS